MGKGLDTGKTFWQGVISKITDPEQRAAAERLQANQDFLTTLGNGVEGQSEIDKQLQQLSQQKSELDTRKDDLDKENTRLGTWHDSLTGWYDENKALLEAGKKVKANPNPNPAPADGFTQKQFEENIANERASFLGFSRDQNLITREHFGKFSEIIDLEPLLRHPQIAQLGLVGVYELVHKDRLEKWKTDTTAAEKKKIEDEAVRKYQETQAQMPYPAPTGAGSGSPLDALTVKVEPLVDAATAHYNRLQAERTAGTRA